MAKLKPGDLVYRVEEYDPPHTKTPHTWIVESRPIKSISDKRIVLVAWFRGLCRTQYPPSALGIVFFASEKEALNAFEERCRRSISTAAREISEAQRAIEWVGHQR